MMKSKTYLNLNPFLMTSLLVMLTSVQAMTITNAKASSFNTRYPLTAEDGIDFFNFHPYRFARRSPVKISSGRHVDIYPYRLVRRFPNADSAEKLMARGGDAFNKNQQQQKLFHRQVEKRRAISCRAHPAACLPPSK